MSVLTRYNFKLMSHIEEEERLVFVSNIINEEIPTHLSIMQNVRPFMYYLYSKYQMPNKDNRFSYMVIINNDKFPTFTTTLGYEYVDYLYYGDNCNFLLSPYTCAQESIRGSAYVITVLLHVEHNEGISNTLSLMNELKFRPKFSDEVRIIPIEENFYYNYNIYESGVTTAKNLNIEHYVEILKRIKPFLYYLASFTSTKFSTRYEYKYDIDVIIMFENYPNAKAVEGYTLMSYPNDEMIFLDTHSNTIFTDEKVERLKNNNSFRIRLELDAKWLEMDILDEETIIEYDNVERIPPSVPLFATYRTDTCVICLVNEPNILTSICSHINTCTACEKINPIATCPSCRSPVKRKFCL